MIKQVSFSIANEQLAADLTLTDLFSDLVTALEPHVEREQLLAKLGEHHA